MSASTLTFDSDFHAKAGVQTRSEIVPYRLPRSIFLFVAGNFGTPPNSVYPPESQNLREDDDSQVVLGILLLCV